MANSHSEAELLVPGISALLEHRVAKMTEDYVQTAVKEFEERLRREVAVAAMEVSGFYELSRSENRVTISVRLK